MKSPAIALVFAVAVLLAIAVFSLAIGAVSISRFGVLQWLLGIEATSLTDNERTILMQVRLPRVITACLISAQPSTFVPYWNCFVGNGRPQSVARAGNAGGILRNTGINFETDGLTNYPTLNATASNSYGGAVGLNVLSADFRKQLVFEFAALDTYGNPALSAAAGPEYALGARFQTALNNRLIWRVDLMNGWFDNAPDIYGTRTEIRWKF